MTTLAETASCPSCDTDAAPVLADTANLLLYAARLAGQMAAARLEAANLRAAIRAALAAAADGEPDPLAYLRDETGEGWCR
jgi:hypothetical protein